MKFNLYNKNGLFVRSFDTIESLREFADRKLGDDYTWSEA